MLLRLAKRWGDNDDALHAGLDAGKGDLLKFLFLLIQRRDDGPSNRATGFGWFVVLVASPGPKVMHSNHAVAHGCKFEK